MVTRTLTVFKTLSSRGKSDTPPSKVSTDDSRKLSELRRDETQSAYDAVPGAEAVVAMVGGGGGSGGSGGSGLEAGRLRRVTMFWPGSCCVPNLL
jgi:hypothetical protein